MHILITGASGFVGKRLAKHLKEKGHQLSLTTRNVDKLKKYLPDFDIFSVDFAKPEFSKLPKDIDMIIHLAATNFQHSKDNPALAEQVNVQGTKELLTWSKNLNLKRVIYFSTVHVYGAPLVGELHEEKDIIPHSTYAKTHYEAEKLVENSKQPFSIVRLANSFGANDNLEDDSWKLVVNHICKSVVSSDEMTFNSNGHAKRNFIPMENLLYYMEKIVQNPHDGVLNIGQDELSIREIASIVAEVKKVISGKTTEFSFNEDDDSTHPDFVYSTKKLHAIYGEAPLTVRDGIEKLFKYSLKTFNS